MNRVLRAQQAPAYLGMSRRVFDQFVKPYVPRFPIGRQGVGYDRQDLDAWLDEYKSRYGRTAVQALEENTCPSSEPAPSTCLGSTNGKPAVSGSATSTKALAHVKKRKR